MSRLLDRIRAALSRAEQEPEAHPDAAVEVAHEVRGAPVEDEVDLVERIYGCEVEVDLRGYATLLWSGDHLGFVCSLDGGKWRALVRVARQADQADQAERAGAEEDGA